MTDSDHVVCTECHFEILMPHEWPCRVCVGDGNLNNPSGRSNTDTKRSHFIEGHNPLRAAVMRALEFPDESSN